MGRMNADLALLNYQSPLRVGFFCYAAIFKSKKVTFELPQLGMYALRRIHRMK